MMRTHIIYRYLLVIFLITMGANVVMAQSRKTVSRPPWIAGEAPSWTVGELPRIDLQGNMLRVEFAQDANPEMAEKKAEEAVARYLLKRAGVDISAEDVLTLSHDSEIITRGSKSKMSAVVKEQYKSQVIVNGTVYGRYSLLDRYTQYKGGRYYFAGLFLVAEQGMSLASVPPITYGVDRGAWRSLLIPGWAQLYTGRTGAGIGYMAVQAGLIASTIYLHSRADYSWQRMNESRGIQTKQIYKKDYDQMIAYRNISAGVCVAWYALNAVDAFTSKRGKLYYTVAYGQAQLALAPTPIVSPASGELGFGLACNIKF